MQENSPFFGIVTPFPNLEIRIEEPTRLIVLPAVNRNEFIKTDEALNALWHF